MKFCLGDEANKKFGCKKLKDYLDRYRDAHQRASRHRDFDEQLLDTYSLYMTQRNLLGKDSEFVGRFGNSKVLTSDPCADRYVFGTCYISLHDGFHYDTHTKNLNNYENTDGYGDYRYKNDLWIHDYMDYDEENNYRINLMNYFDIRDCFNRKRQEKKDPSSTGTIEEWGASSDDTDYEYDENKA